MKLFEHTWRDGYTYYERCFCTELNKTIKRRIDIPWEWYVPQSSGQYSSILDDTVKLTKKQGNSKESKGHYGITDPMYRNIRDNYWNVDAGGYHTNARTWYLDIETRVGVSYKHDYDESEVVEVHTSTSASFHTVGELRRTFKDADTVGQVVVANGTETPLSKTMFMERNVGFPAPGKANEEISLMQIWDSTSETMIVIGLREWKHQADYDVGFQVKYIKCSDERQLLETYLDVFKRLDPLIVYAWNGDKFDFPYVYNRLSNVGVDPNRLSNYGSVSLTDHEFKGQIEYKLNAAGHYYLDLLPVYKKFTFKPRPNYTLDTIAEIELGENKVQHTEYAAFDDFYTGKYVIPSNPSTQQKNSKIYKAAVRGDWDEVKELAHSEFVYYGCVDTFLIKRIDEKRNFTTMLFLISEKMGVQLNDALGTVKPWSQYIGNKALLNNQVIPPRVDHPQPNVTGGYVREPEKGKHEWIISEDVNSMYPLLGMVGFNMSPETFIPTSKMHPEVRDLVLQYFNDQNEQARIDQPEEVKHYTKQVLKKHNIALGVNGAAFKRDRVGIIPGLILEIYNDRKKAKCTQINYEERAILIQTIINKKNSASTQQP